MASARVMPIALTLMRTSFGPGAGTRPSTNSRSSGPPAFANLIVRDMAVSVKSDRLRDSACAEAAGCFWLQPLRGGRFQGRKIGVAVLVATPESARRGGRAQGQRDQTLSVLAFTLPICSVRQPHT